MTTNSFETGAFAATVSSVDADAASQVLQPGARASLGARWVELYSCADLPSRFGAFRIYVFRTSDDAFEHVALVHGDVWGQGDVPTRIHSECLTGDVLGSLRCDCREQLEMSMKYVGERPRGVVLYMRQEGRGIGLGNKIRAYELQAAGLDTFEANVQLGFGEDDRDYGLAALMLRVLSVASVQLLTNNPRKVFGLRVHGVRVSGRIPVVGSTNTHNAEYLRAKAQKSGHLLPVS